MKILNLDIKSKNKNIGQVEKCDTVKLIATLEDKDYSNSTIRILGKKADKTFVEQFVQAENNKIEATLKEQFTTCEGITRLEINIVTGEEEWTSSENYFYISSTLNSNIIESINDVKTLNDLDHYLIYAKQEIKDIKAELETVSMDKLLEIKMLLEIENVNANANVQALRSLILQAVDIRNNLNSSINTANDSNLELKKTTTQANTSKELLENTTTIANTSKKALDGSITSANNIDRTLKETTTLATTLKSNLEKVINAANTSKTNLENTTAAANTKKTELDKSITNATSKITEITNKNTEATTNINTLKSKITEANTCKTNLDTSIEEGQATKTAIDEAIVNGDLEKTNAQLLEMTQEVKEARTDYFGKEHATLKEKEDREFEFVHIDNSKGMFVESSTTTGHMKIENSIEGRARDSVIKGRTLQNLVNVKQFENTDATYKQADLKLSYTLSANKDYTLIYDVVIPNTQIKTPDRHTPYIEYEDGTKEYQGFEGFNTTIGTKIWKLPSSKNIVKIYYWISNTTGKVDNIRLLEGDYTNKPIPSYFEGIKSLGEEENKISILSTGKNLCNGLNLDSGLILNKIEDNKDCWNINPISTVMSKDKIAMMKGYRFKPNTQYTIRYDYKSTGLISLNIFYTDGTNTPYYGGELNIWQTRNVTSTTGKTIKEIQWTYNSGSNSCYIDKNSLIVVEGTTINEYEAYKEDKKDILIPVSHGAKGLGNVADEILPNGDYLQKIDRVTFTGDESGYYYEPTKCFVELKPQPNMKSRSTLTGTLNTIEVFDENNLGIQTTIHGAIRIKPLLGRPTKEECINTIKENNVTVYYELAEPILHKAETQTNDNFTTFKDVTHISCLNKIAPSNMSAKFPVDTAATLSRLNVENKNLEKENEILKNDLLEQALYFNDKDLDLMTNTLDLDFRLLDIELALDIPINLNMKGNDNMNQYEMMKTLILAGRYERADMEIKVDKYLKYNKITQEQADELIALMDAREIIK